MQNITDIDYRLANRVFNGAAPKRLNNKMIIEVIIEVYELDPAHFL